MHNFIQRNKKKLLAFFGVLLMITFALSGSLKGGNGVRELTVGKVGDVKVTSQDLEQASSDIHVIQASMYDLFTKEKVSPAAQLLFQSAFLRSYESKPITYVLLQKEAEAAGITPPAESVEALAAELHVQNKDADDDPRAIARRYLLVWLNSQRAMGGLKVTLPQVQQRVAMQQEPTLNLIEFKAEDFLASVPPIPPEQVQATYDRFASVPQDAAESASSTQPVRFGYRLPDRVTLQYLQLPKARLFDAVLHTLTRDEEYAVDRLSLGYLNAHKDEEFAPDTGKLLGPSKSYSDIRASLRRRLLLGEIQPPADALQNLIAQFHAVQERVNKKSADLRIEIADRLNADYQAHLKGEPVLLAPVPMRAAATQPSTRPASQPAPEPQMAPGGPAPAFETSAYLEAVLVNVLDRAGAGLPAPKPPLPTISALGLTIDLDALAFDRLSHSMDDKWYTAETLTQASDINKSSYRGTDTFPQLATEHAVELPTTAPASLPATSPTTSPATMASTQPAIRSALAIYQPSPLLTNTSNGDGFIFRLTAFSPTRVPAFSEVREKIASDLRTNASFQEAAAKADTVRKASINHSGDANGGLAFAADLTGDKLIVAGPIARPGSTIPGYIIPKEDLSSAGRISSAAYILMSKASIQQPHPSVLIDLPQVRKVLAAELRSVERGWTQQNDYTEQRQIVQQMQQNMDNQGMSKLWFSPDSVARRVKYTPVGKG